MSDTITINNNRKRIHFDKFDSDKEMEINIDDDAYIYLSPNEVNSIINYLANQLKSINEPVELLEQIKP